MADVVVVGGGVAGSAVAITLARRGRAVVLVDRSTFPRRKACGEGLFPRGVRELQGLGVLDHIESFARLDRLRFHFEGQTAEASLGTASSPAIGVQRLLLDEALLCQARAAGIEVRTGCRVLALLPEGERYSLLTDAGEMQPAAIVAADGAGSALRRQAGLDGGRTGKRYGVSAHVELAAAPDGAVDVFFQSGFEVYVTPVGGRLANVAALMSKPRTKVLAGGARRAFEELLGACPLGQSWRLIDEPLAAGPFPVRARGLWRNNLLLAGDAAGFFDGITGEGMSLALLSAREASTAVDAYLATGSTEGFQRYEAQRRKLARGSELLGRLTLLLAARPWSARRALRGLSRRPQAFSRLVAVSSGELALRSLSPSDLLALLLG